MACEARQLEKRLKKKICLGVVANHAAHHAGQFEWSQGMSTECSFQENPKILIYAMSEGLTGELAGQPLRHAYNRF